MTLGCVKPGDIVLADMKGRRFFAIVTAGASASSRSNRSTDASPITA